jgi:hypothetical protein
MTTTRLGSTVEASSSASSAASPATSKTMNVVEHPHLGVARSGIPIRRVDGRNRHRPSDIVDVSVAIYGRVIVTQERRKHGPGSFVQVADSAYREEEVGTG